jgi:hypothetical protein
MLPTIWDLLQAMTKTLMRLTTWATLMLPTIWDLLPAKTLMTSKTI